MTFNIVESVCGLYQTTKCHYIYFAGCYATSEIQNNTNKTFKLSISSPPLCQERCLQEKINLFALQVCKYLFVL